MGHLDFLELVLADEVTRRDALSATLRSQRARLDPTMTLEAWDDSSKVNFDRGNEAERRACWPCRRKASVNLPQVVKTLLRVGP
jgi:hypothetical protein